MLWEWDVTDDESTLLRSNENDVILTLMVSWLAATEVVILTTYDASSSENFQNEDISISVFRYIGN